MTFSLAVAATAFLLIFPVELPDKTFVATLVLATRFRPLWAWLGVVAAFLVQTVVACLAGTLLATLPHTPVVVLSLAMFLIGGIVLIRGARKADEEEAEAEEEFTERTAGRRAEGLKAVATSFAILFVAEWGDLSQLLTANLVLRYGDPLSVGVGAWLALVVVSGLAAMLGKALLRKVSLSTIRMVGGVVCLLLAALTALELAGVELPFP